MRQPRRWAGRSVGSYQRGLLTVKKFVDVHDNSPECKRERYVSQSRMPTADTHAILSIYTLPVTQQIDELD